MASMVRTRAVHEHPCACTGVPAVCVHLWVPASAWRLRVCASDGCCFEQEPPRAVCVESGAYQQLVSMSAHLQASMRRKRPTRRSSDKTAALVWAPARADMSRVG